MAVAFLAFKSLAGRRIILNAHKIVSISEEPTTAIYGVQGDPAHLYIEMDSNTAHRVLATMEEVIKSLAALAEKGG